MFRVLTILLFTLISYSFLYGQVNNFDPDKKVRILFLLDGSGSMLSKWDGEVKMTTAKKLLMTLVDSLKPKTNIELALRVYGHQFDKRFNNCTDTKLEIGFRGDNHESIKAKLRSLKPQGTTPISYSLEQAAKDFSSNQNTRNVVVMITDGEESCSGDPCAVSLELQKKKVFLKPFIIGIGDEIKVIDAFECMGQYFDARNIEGFRLALDKVIKQITYKSTVTVNLLDSKNQATETNVPIAFVNNVTNEVIHHYVHRLDEKKMPDTLIMDPVISYDLHVSTIPEVVKKGIILEGGEHSRIELNTPQGTLAFNQPNYSEYKTLPQALIKKDNEIIYTQKLDETQQYLVDTYDIEVLTLPRVIFKDVKINQSQTTELTLPAPGILNMLDNLNGYGSLYKIYENGGQEWFYNFENNKTNFSIALQPGTYKLVFRAENAFTSRFTDVQEFAIRSGSIVNIKLFNK